MRCHSGRLWYSGAEAVANAIGYAQFYSRSHDAETDLKMRDLCLT